jgi:hypothetical protein
VQNVQAIVEICDGLDNNCDGQVDNGNPGGGQSCNTGKPGVCAAGTTTCLNGAVVCAQNVQPSAEVCDGKDNDCDGQVDDGNPGGGASCGTGKPGVCGAGTSACSNGVVICNQNVQPSAEVCDGLDNNCDGVLDNNVTDTGQACNTGLLGNCSSGNTTCAGGKLTCTQINYPVAEICDNAVDDNCDGVTDPAATVYFSESFANNLAGWTLGPEWQIGPAVAGPAGSCADPGLDHTATADNGVAGVVLGGCSTSSVTKTTHGYYYLTSPIINTASAPKLILSFYRWLFTDVPGRMNSTVEVWNGVGWVVIWQSASALSDTSWLKVSYDVTAYKNAGMQVRFGFDIGSTSVSGEGSWNIDDVQLTDGACN